MPLVPQPQIASQVARLPLAKFSHTATSIDHSGPLSWIHVNGHGDLVCLLDKFSGSSSTPSRLILRVVNNHGVLVRRFQLKFTQDRDYYSTLAILSGINCPLTEGSASTQTLQRPPSTSSWTSVPSVQLVTTTLRNVNNAMTPDSNGPGPFYPVVGYEPGVHISSSQTSDAISVQKKARHIASESQNLEQERVSSRPASTPACHDEGQLNRMLPPRRELPFSKTGKRKSRADSTSERISEQFVPQSSTEQEANALRIQRPDPLSETKALSRPDSYVPDSQPRSPSQPFPSAQPDQVRRSPELQPSAAPSQRLPRTMVRGRSPENADTQLARTQEYIPTYQVTSTENQLEQYINSPSAERIAFLENWMCELLDDDKFLTLCQDVEGTWRRFAFGQKRGLE
ncbi:hypothetical protein N7448_005116 [Penicillium atrosanguineum]|uniref:Uncharacterized protein n=1 Tax=Penicillium atrosanguineum TaxID=1132637 RepID=A0A9W9L591_9EURO|nr:uncharacterized protein N7443_008846 [Penicillium atrosanguineum]KAJ5125802.1 hypothetical protein N7526_007979 [Penicillium atrosanguineum]KAJ5136562.1 hypothetical protein N7448_005116 [Penicillium atrosanguineum]KAJ5292893.1 hypothetical protein N7443_008846 [Penicillium atrosanguineum]KAJ5303070.1 hypothetical protein N7476_009869 [Penicillium atrosanguineum]